MKLENDIKQLTAKAVEQQAAASPGPSPASGSPPPEGLITRHELAHRLHKSLRTINYWQRHGILPYVKCGKSVYYNWTDVEAHLHNHFRICRRPMQRTTGRKGHRIPCIRSGPTERKTKC